MIALENCTRGATIYFCPQSSQNSEKHYRGRTKSAVSIAFV